MTVVSPLGYRFPGGTYTIAHWENWLLTDCTTAEPLPDDLAHPVALFHVPILGAGTSITTLFELESNLKCVVSNVSRTRTTNAELTSITYAVVVVLRSSI